MKLGLRFLLIAGLIIQLQQLANAQTISTNQFLSKVGITDSINSGLLNESREIFIQLPVSYNPGKNQKYPVVYILDGEIFLPTVSDVQNYYSGGFTPEMVLVGIANNKNRIRDLTTSTITTRYGVPFNEENGGAENFHQFIEKELIPYIEENYAVSNFRTLIGHSYGGLFTIYSLFKHPHLFANYLAIDPSLDWDEQKILNESQKIFSSQNYEGKSLFMSLSGQLHMQDSKITIDNVMQDTTDYTLFSRSNIKFSNTVRQHTKNGLFFDWKFYPDDLHGTVPYPSIRDGLIALFKWYQMENTDKFNSFDTPKEELLGIIKYREKKLKDHFRYPEPPYPEELLNMLGYMNLEIQQAEKAKMYFGLAIEYYPESANAYGSMADCYEAENDAVNALKYANKAYELSGSDSYKIRIDELKKKIK